MPGAICRLRYAGATLSITYGTNDDFFHLRDKKIGKSAGFYWDFTRIMASPVQTQLYYSSHKSHITHILSFSIRKVPALRDGCSSFIPMALKKSNCAKSDKIQLSSNNTFQPQLHSQSSSAHHLQRIVIQLFQIKRKSSRCITTAALF